MAKETVYMISCGARRCRFNKDCECNFGKGKEVATLVIGTDGQCINKIDVTRES